jgi:hypothetical protein
MHHFPLLLIAFYYLYPSHSQSPYPNHAIKLPKHPSNWICTVHVTVATFANYTSSDITESFLASNREDIIPTLSTMLDRNISIAPVISFFEPCTISILIDAIINGSSYISGKHGIAVYIPANKYIFRGWRHSVIIVIHFTCFPTYHVGSKSLPHRLFYHSTTCGPQNTFPNHVYVPGPAQYLLTMNDPKYNIHHRTLPLEIKRFISTPKYSWDHHHHNPNGKFESCFPTRWNQIPIGQCSDKTIAVYYFQHFLNFTTVAYTRDSYADFGGVFSHYNIFGEMNSIYMHAVGSRSDRIIYCDRNSDSLRHRPLKLLSPFIFRTWVLLVLLLILCATASTFAIFDFSSVSNNWTSVAFIKMVLSSLVDHVVLLLDQDLGKNSTTKIFVGLIVICLGNDYKNHLTIELVYPRTQDAIQNVTELLDLNFKIMYIYKTGKVLKDVDKPMLLKSSTLYWGIDKAKREKYALEVKRWLMLVDRATGVVQSKITNLTEKNAYLVTAPYHRQVNVLSKFNEESYPISCRFVKQPFAPKFINLYFYNPKAEEFKWLTAKFLDHGFFKIWKGWETQRLSLIHRRGEKRIKSSSNSSSTEVPDINNFIGQLHLFVFYKLISILTGICIAVFVLECAIQDAEELSLFVFAKFIHIILEIYSTILRSLCLMSRLLIRIYEKS